MSRIGKRTSDPGFTLIELLIVVTIVLVVIGLSAPNLRTAMDTLGLERAGRDLAQCARLAAYEAVQQERTHRVSWDAARREFRIFVADDSEDFVRVPGRTGRAWPLHDQVSLEGEWSSVDFYPDGSAQAALIRLQNSKGAELRIQIWPQTAKVEIQFEEAS
ncbi:MAG: prepilin-type N-terminal cleavage/methylation domain-containing protein [Candidatus Omnitrophica bacterium]|nr:prepilin-type N-terminal cleavage/methylation domain-containing protein [Candidatus Omnitrophota bacterium]